MNYANLLSRLLNREDLPHDDMHELMRNIMSGQLTPIQIAAVLVALHMKGETVTEIAAAAQVMRDLSSKVTVQDGRHLIDTCGTGGDGAQTFNISTASALVAAAAGARVAKHGGRSVSSTCGSADILEKLGVQVNLTPQQVAHCVQEIGVGFMFAPNHHSAMKYAAPVRRELGVRTLFNLLGPLTNPAGAQNQVMGVFQRDLTVKLARVLQQLGSQHVLVVHGADGMDEISISGSTYIAELRNGTVFEYSVQPQDFDLHAAPLDSIRVANADEARTVLLSVLDNQRGPARDIVQLNAGAAIYVAGLTATLQEGVKKAKEVIASGAAKNKLEELVHIHL
ncbi:MAG: anthranilate phosphoribosyltransferase [Candidatus Nitrotoga sp. LAW]|nr:MAG: anthranilate phosphoribosyltransferase [Candidatus Nitrotoga sp. LAW]